MPDISTKTNQVNTYVYMDNSGKSPKLVCLIQAGSITEADKKLQELHGITPVKAPHVGCIVNPKKDQHVHLS
jgi:hypothetical protein